MIFPDQHDFVKDAGGGVDDALRERHSVELQEGFVAAHSRRSATEQDVAAHEADVTIRLRMTRSLAVIIPALNEEAQIERAIVSAWRGGASEVIVGDGGSSDATAAVARANGARVVICKRGRGAQNNAAAREAASELLAFLHADTELPSSAAGDIDAALTNSMFGGFRLTFREPLARLRAVAWLINFRTSMTGCPWGDQAQFVTRETFWREGGYAEYPFMEDYDFALRMRRKYGRAARVDAPVRTSGRRFLERGVVRTSVMNWRLIIAFRRGASPADLARRYRS